MKISDIERAVGVTAGTLRYWEERGLLSSERSDNHYRTYTEEDIGILLRIKEMREIGVAIADIKLWRDGIVDYKTLLLSHRRRMDEDDKESRRLRAMCDRMIASQDGYTDHASPTPFTESDVTPHGKLLLGIDIGTTSVSAQLISLADGEPLHTYCINHSAALPAENPFGEDAFAADAELLLKTALGLVHSAVDTYPNIAAIGFAGQMHGIVCTDDHNTPLSPLFTWQNLYGQRILDGESVCDRIARLSGIRIPTGYGIVTYYALRECGLLPKGTVHITTVSDLAAAHLCGGTLRCHPTNAASFGCYDMEKNDFDASALSALGIDRSILPEIAEDFALAGTYRNIPVTVSVGDNQAGVFATLRDEDAALLNIGTGGQISRIGTFGILDPLQNSVEIRPYFGGKSLCSGSILSGGRALALLASFLCEVADAFGVTPTKQDIYDCINRAALSSEKPLTVDTAFGGTRDDPDRRGAVTDITPHNFTLSDLSAGFCFGIVTELYSLCQRMGGEMPMRLVISGNALRRNAALRHAAMRVFSCPLVTPAYKEEAALCAALYAGIGANLLTPETRCDLIRYEALT